ncbi:MAG: calcium/sodium antiporter [Bacteroidales bacterium]|nr:calcium/sodium antiporter [Bacteroidales bacterium]
MLVSVLLLVLGFGILIKGADWLVNGSVSIAKHYHVSELAIGLTIVAFGTSAPELVVNIVSSLNGYSDVTMGNVVGSNLFNLMLILGLTGVVYPLVVQVRTIWNEIPFSLAGAIILLVLANYTFSGESPESLNRVDGIILLLCFIGFMGYIIVNLRDGKETLEADFKILKPSHSVVLIGVGLIALVLGSRLVVDHAVKIAEVLGISEKIIGITIVSAGTSLPELVTSVVAALKKRSDIAVGNIIGSNIFNIFLILGVSAVISPIRYNTSFNFDILVLTGSTVLLFVFMFSGKKHKLDRWESILFLVAYVAYIVYLLR